MCPPMPLPPEGAFHTRHRRPTLGPDSTGAAYETPAKASSPLRCAPDRETPAVCAATRFFCPAARGHIHRPWLLPRGNTLASGSERGPKPSPAHRRRTSRSEHVAHSARLSAACPLSRTPLCTPTGQPALPQTPAIDRPHTTLSAKRVRPHPTRHVPPRDRVSPTAPPHPAKRSTSHVDARDRELPPVTSQDPATKTFRLHG